MKRTFAALVLAAALLGAAACSSSTTSTTNTTAAPGTTAGTTATTAKSSSSSTSSGSSSSKTPKVTKPATVDKSKIDESKIPSGVRTSRNIEMSEEESDCVAYVIYETYNTNPDLGTDDATASGVAGAAIVACVPQDKIAAAIVQMLKANTQLTDTQIECVGTEIKAADGESLALFLGAMAYSSTGDDSALKPFTEALGQACNIA